MVLADVHRETVPWESGERNQHSDEPVGEPIPCESGNTVELNQHSEELIVETVPLESVSSAAKPVPIVAFYGRPKAKRCRPNNTKCLQPPAKCRPRKRNSRLPTRYTE